MARWQSLSQRSLLRARAGRGRLLPFNRAVANSFAARRAYQKSAASQTKVGQAIIACALESYRLVHNEYPQDLATLVPQSLASVPRDVIGGQPPIYHRNADGTFLLYSIGWSGRDGGGVGGKSEEEGDWVWPGPF
jgi:hypothetical protein